MPDDELYKPDTLHPRWWNLIERIRRVGHGQVTIKFADGLPMQGEHPLERWRFDDDEGKRG